MVRPFAREASLNERSMLPRKKPKTIKCLPYKANIEGKNLEIIGRFEDGSYRLQRGRKLVFKPLGPDTYFAYRLARVSKLAFVGGEWMLDDENIKAEIIAAASREREHSKYRSKVETLTELFETLSAIANADRARIKGVAWFDELSEMIEGESTQSYLEREDFLNEELGMWRAKKAHPRPPANRDIPILLIDFGVVTEKPKAQAMARPTAKKPVARFENDFSVAVIPQKNGKEVPLTIETELQALIQNIVAAGGNMPRTKLRNGKSDTYQPEKLLMSKTAKALKKAKLLGTNRSGRTTIFWAKRRAP